MPDNLENNKIPFLEKLIEERSKCSYRMYFLKGEQLQFMLEAIKSIDKTILEISLQIVKQ